MLAACVDWIPSIDNKPQIIIYPNPARNQISISSNDEFTINEIIIYNQFGQILLHINKTTKNIDVSTLSQGIYVIELVMDDLRLRKKLIIEK